MSVGIHFEEPPESADFEDVALVLFAVFAEDEAVQQEWLVDEPRVAPCATQINVCGAMTMLITASAAGPKQIWRNLFCRKIYFRTGVFRF